MRQGVVSANRENARIAARGMYLAAAELCRYGFNVTPTSRNMTGADSAWCRTHETKAKTLSMGMLFTLTSIMSTLGLPPER